MNRILLLLFWMSCWNSIAQIYPTIGQFHLNQLYYNPAYAGSASKMRALLLHRSQWAKMPGAPNTQVISSDLPIGKNVGVGGVLSRHALGDLKQINFAFNASYRLDLGKESFLQFGLKAGIGHVDFGFLNAYRWDEVDPYIAPNTSRGVVGTVGTGIYLKKKSFYVGLSVPDLVMIDPNQLYFDQTLGKSLVKRNFFFNSGFKWNVTEFFALQPDVLIRYYPTRPINYYFNLSFIFNQTFTAGVGFVYPKGMSFYSNVNITPKVLIGYRYELFLNSFGYSSYGTNEILLRYGFN